MRLTGLSGRRALPTSKVVGAAVRNPHGQSLGKIEDIVLDCETGRIAYAVLTFGGFLGIGDKLFAIPWDAFELDQDEAVFRLNVPRAQLKAAPGFDKDRWPDFADRTWAEGIHTYYDETPYWLR